ncbi:MAG: glucosaminidase domain-containing protein [Bacteroidales bacterium]|nr:glucosaminidase domain-containing protein [Bacteroidales bacterium]MBP5795747.1 glucosaminidase domain-containing protein [Bacteroidales bacterium]
MKKIIALLSLCLVCFLSADGQTSTNPQQAYIDTYSQIAIQEMQRSGIPASITLAQGMLESRYGLSDLAIKGNNHFGIKCHDWTGKSIKMDDERPGECFRAYASADESFKDHSDFLRFRDRYRFLFDYDITDYRSWAYGLSKAGYATDPEYPAKLIKLIEDFDLSKFDKLNRRQMRDLPQTPTSLEAVSRLEGKALEKFNFPLSRAVYTQNDVPFIYVQEGETFKSIAESNKLFLKELLRFNDLSKEIELHPGDIVYLKNKKKESKKGLDKYVVDQEGETLWAICQRFAVQQKEIEKLNGFKKDHVLREGDMIYLRKVK